MTFQELVAQTRHYVEELLSEERVLLSTPLPPVKREEKKEDVQKPVEVSFTPPVPKKGVEVHSAKSSALASMRQTLSFVAPTLSLLPKPASLYLVAFEKKPGHTAFLEGLSSAINDQLTLAEIVFCKNEQEIEKLVETPYLRLLLAPLKNRPIHKIENKICALAPLEEYQNDLALKRSLWNLLKSHFSPLSSSTLRSTKR